MTTLARFGITCALPPGWEGAIFRRPPGRGEQTHPVVHLATFALPASRGDFGNGAVDLMGPGDVLVVLLEYGPAGAGTALFGHEGLPASLSVGDFSPTTLQRAVPGQAGTQFFCTAAGRPLCLYVVLGSWARAARLVARANEALAGIGVAAASEAPAGGGG